MHRILSGVLVSLTAGVVWGDVFSYESDSMPEDGGWEVIQEYCEPVLQIEEGWFVIRLDFCPGSPPPGGQQVDYTRSIVEFIGSSTYFVEFRGESTAPASELPIGGGGFVSAWSVGGVNYKNNFASDLVELWRDNHIPTVYVSIAPGLPHTYRLELYGSSLYVWYIDGHIVDSGLPEGPYPIANAHINFDAGMRWFPSTTRFDYIRFGDIPDPGSGDFDSDADRDLRDYGYFHECLSNGGIGVDPGPSCRWADINFDFACDMHDFGAFQRAFTGGDNE